MKVDGKSERTVYQDRKGFGENGRRHLFLVG